MNTRRTTLTTAVALGLLMGGCSTMPPTEPAVDAARMAIEDVERLPKAEAIAGEELDAARDSLARAERHLAERDDLHEVRHDAYLALRHAEIADERVQESLIRDQIGESETERTEVLLTAREHDVDTALALANLKAQEAERRQIEAARARLDASQATAEADRASALAAATLAENRDLRAELETMEIEFTELQAEQTDRGLVLTLGDVLFDTDRTTLKPGASLTMDRLAAFLNDHPERALLIEGHTDSQGSDTYNHALSVRRAEAVNSALIARGVSAHRLEPVGLGEEYPVATNDTVAGRQENRRVEIVVSDHNGDFPELAVREFADH